MRIWRFHGTGSTDDLPVPEPAAGDALVKLEHAALNPADAFWRVAQGPMGEVAVNAAE